MGTDLMLGSQKKLQRFLLLSPDSPSLPRPHKTVFTKNAKTVPLDWNTTRTTDKDEVGMGTGIELTPKPIPNYKHHKSVETVWQKASLKSLWC